MEFFAILVTHRSFPAKYGLLVKFDILIPLRLGK
jgi:hypothetical protein